MNVEYLILRARKIPVSTKRAVQEYHEKSELLITAINEKMMARSDLKKLIGEGSLDMMKDNHANHVRFIHAILKNPNPEVLTDTILWVFRTYKNHGFTGNYWAAQLNLWREVLKEILSPSSFEQIYPLYEWIQVNIPFFEMLAEEVKLPAKSKQ